MTLKTEYRVVTGTEKEFSKLVAVALDDGWELQGGVAISFALHAVPYYAQALIRRSAASQPSAGHPSGSET